MKTQFMITLILGAATVLSAIPFSVRADSPLVPEANVSSLSDASPTARAWYLKPSLQVSQAFYRETQPVLNLRRSVDETLLNAVVDGGVRLGSSAWSLGSRVSASVVPLIRDTSDLGFLDARLFGEYVAWTGRGWSLALQLGGSYATTYGASDLGYINLVGPMAGVWLRKVTALGDIASVYARADVFTRQFTTGQIDAGFSYLFSQGGSDHGFEFSAELAYLGASWDSAIDASSSGTSRADMTSVVASLGLGYRF